MLKAYIDGSGTGDARAFVLAGYIATAERWAQFSDEWQKLLDMKPHSLPYFKMKEMKTDMERCGWFYRVIENHVVGAVSCVIDVPALKHHAREYLYVTPPHMDPDHTGEIANPYFPAFYNLVMGLAKKQIELQIDEPVDYIFDNDTEKKRVLEGWDYMRLNLPPEVLKLLGDTPIFRDDKTTLPLQAADLYAYWVRQWHLDGNKRGIRYLRFPWKISRPDLLRLNWTLSDKELKKAFESFDDPKRVARLLLTDAIVRGSKRSK